MDEHDIGDTHGCLSNFYGPTGCMWYDLTPKIPIKLLYFVTSALEAGRAFDIYYCSEFDVDYHVPRHGLGWYSPGTGFGKEVW